MRNKFLDKINGFYFIGIGGVSMSSLAKLLIKFGKTVAGSDVRESEYTEELRKIGVGVYIGSLGDSVADFDAVVYTDAVSRDDIQLGEARSLGKEIFSRGQLLYEISREFGKVIAVAGCHGKTTCTAMLAHIFAADGKKFAAHIGGLDKTLSNSYYCGNDYFLTEACEYKKNFLLLQPDISVILNTEPDHLECYGSADNLRSAYLRFAMKAGTVISMYGDMAIGGITFGKAKCADYYAKNIAQSGGIYSFDVFANSEKLGNIQLSLYGKHNILNALAAIAAARSVGIPFASIQAGLRNFAGVQRRFERIGAYNGAVCIADYAHHPDEIKATLATAKRLTHGKIFVIFQPHTYSRTKNLFDRFVKVLSKTDNLLIYKTYAAREYFDDSGSALTLSQSIKKSRYGDEETDIENFIFSAGRNDIILFLGAGDIYNIAQNIVKNKG